DGTLGAIGGFGAIGISRDPRTAAADLLSEIVNDPVVGPEARLRLGYLLWIAGRDAAAQSELIKAAAQAADPDLRYLAQFLVGWAKVDSKPSARRRRSCR